MGEEPDITVQDAPDRSQYEITVDGVVGGVAAYRTRPDRIVFTHTEVNDAFAGRGLGGTLARGALDDVRSRGLKVTPLCPFIAAYIRRHPEYADIVAG